MIKMKILLLILILVVYSCGSPKPETVELKAVLDELGDWKVIKLTQREIDTTNIGNWLPDAAISATFQDKMVDSTTCLKPYLEFYPLAMRDYIEKKLTTYLILRSSLYPPPPNTYTNTDYFIVGWNFKGYDTLVCCQCDVLEKELMMRLNMQKSLTVGNQVENLLNRKE